ncbi:MAG: hypothetical protein WDM96_02430 [Lacunisphaera sp.]
MLSGGERNRVLLARVLKSEAKPPAARRADQRPRREFHSCARGSARDLRRLRG